MRSGRSMTRRSTPKPTRWGCRQLTLTSKARPHRSSAWPPWARCVARDLDCLPELQRRGILPRDSGARRRRLVAGARFAHLRCALPVRRVQPALAVAAGALGAYAVWTGLSAIWSDSTWRAMVELDRVLLYLVALVLFGSVAKGLRVKVRWMMRGLALAILVVCTIGLITRLLPDVWPTEPNLDPSRLSYPVTYWNTLGLMAAIGTILCFHLLEQSQRAVAATRGRRRSRPDPRHDALFHLLAGSDPGRRDRPGDLYGGWSTPGAAERPAGDRAHDRDRRSSPPIGPTSCRAPTPPARRGRAGTRPCPDWWASAWRRAHGPAGFSWRLTVG